VRLNEHLEHPEGDVVFRHACKLGAEGIVSQRLDRVKVWALLGPLKRYE
jgi:hypothetical protein